VIQHFGNNVSSNDPTTNANVDYFMVTNAAVPGRMLCCDFPVFARKGAKDYNPLYRNASTTSANADEGCRRLG
jgi:hypothetical protein